jgi:FAD/FMN-containing dehydrogenase
MVMADRRREATEEWTMALSSTRPAPLDIDAIRGRFAGRVLGPGDDGYDAARVVLIGGVDRHPAVIVRVAGTPDVREVIALARETGHELAVRAGGHSGAAFSTVEGGIVLDVRDLTSLEFDAEGRTAWAGAGLTASALTQAADAHDLAVGFGDTGSVGIAGITLGGGVGYLVRLHGLTIDSLLGAEIATADGAVHVVDAEHEPDLFWAIRGGGGNLGVVTRFHYRLHPVPEVTGGMIILPATPQSIAGAVRALDEAPEALSGILNVMPCPPLPFAPAEVHGTPVIWGMACFVGPADQAAAAFAPLRAVARPIADMIRPIRYPEMYPPEDPDYHPKAVSRTLFLDSFDEARAAVALERIEALTSTPVRVLQLRVLGGAAARVPDDATAYAHRGLRLMGNVAAFYDGPDDLAEKTAWVEELTRALDPVPGAYVNFVNDEGPERVHEAYPPATWARLAQVKRRYDPDNVFCRNHNVPPA